VYNRLFILETNTTRKDQTFASASRVGNTTLYSCIPVELFSCITYRHTHTYTCAVHVVHLQIGKAKLAV